MHNIFRQILFLIFSFLAIGLPAQDRYRQYIDRYNGMAVEQMKRYKIPASITLAQGLLESGAGMSRLAREGNNHFGIKVGSSWTGPYMIVSDDRPDDRFRVYRNSKESYEDHSKFLTRNQRYASLFELRPTDYKGWAHGLKRAGYATNPRYAYSLIDIIERYDLTRYDRGHHHKSDKDEKETKAGRIEAATGHTVRRCNGQYYIIAREGDTYASLARRMKTKEKKLRAYNDVDAGKRLQSGDIVYLGKKRKRADRSMKRRYHVMEAGESLYSISQRYGIRLSSLCKMNPISENYRFKVGDEIKIK